MKCAYCKKQKKLIVVHIAKFIKKAAPTCNSWTLIAILEIETLLEGGHQLYQHIMPQPGTN